MSAPLQQSARCHDQAASLLPESSESSRAHSGGLQRRRLPESAQQTSPLCSWELTSLLPKPCRKPGSRLLPASKRRQRNDVWIQCEPSGECEHTSLKSDTSSAPKENKETRWCWAGILGNFSAGLAFPRGSHSTPLHRNLNELRQMIASKVATVIDEAGTGASPDFGSDGCTPL